MGAGARAGLPKFIKELESELTKVKDPNAKKALEAKIKSLKDAQAQNEKAEKTTKQPKSKPQTGQNAQA